MGENVNAVETEEKRVPYTVEIDETIPFNADAETKILTSNELCKLANELFRQLFADYEGCYFEMSKNGPATITAVFNHGKHEEGRHYAVDMAAAKDAGNDVIQRARAFDRLAKEGDRYHITEDGKDIFKKFLAPRFVERNGKVNWGLIVSDYVERPNAFYGTATQYTKIEGIDPRQLCFALFGAKEENGERLDYAVEVRASVSSYNTYGLVAPNYALYILRAHEDNLKETYEKLGFGAVGSGIIR